MYDLPPPPALCGTVLPKITCVKTLEQSLTRLDPQKEVTTGARRWVPSRPGVTWTKVRRAETPVVTMTTGLGQVGTVVLGASSSTV